MLALNLRAIGNIRRAAYIKQKMCVKFKKTAAPKRPFRRKTAINLNKMEIHCSLIFYAFR